MKKSIIKRLQVLSIFIMILLTVSGCAEKQSDDPGKQTDDLGKQADDLGKQADDLGKQADDLEKKTEKRKNILSLEKTEKALPSKVYASDGSLITEISEIKAGDLDNYLVRCIIDAMIRDSGIELSGFPCLDEKMSDSEMDALLSKYGDYLCKNGYEIKTSLNSKVYDILRNSVINETAMLKEKQADGSFCMESCAVCCDRTSGKVIAYVSGRNSEKQEQDFLKMYAYMRRPGSAMKPLILYTPLLEIGYEPESSVIDKQYTESVSNSDGKYEGRVTLEYAVAKSKNTVACEMMALMGPESGIEYLKKMHFDYLTKEDATPYAAIGILEYGVTVPQMCSGFGALANGGVYNIPTCIESIRDSKGNELEVDSSGTKVYSREASEKMTGILKQVFVYGTGKGLLPEGVEGSGKTGTTSGGYDGWMCGYAGDYVTAVWVGAADEKSRTFEMAGNGISGNIWKSFYEGLKKKGYLDKITETDTGSTEDRQDPQEKDEESDTERMIENLIAGMSIEEKIYQLFMVVPEELGTNDEEIKKGLLEEALKEKPVGGLIFFDHNLENPEQVREMLGNLKKNSIRTQGTEMFLAVDEEGGTVTRIAKNKEFNVDNIGPMKNMESENQVYEKARYVGGYLKDLGFNVDLAPDVDLYTPGSVIGSRAFSEDTRVVAKYASAYIQGLHAENVKGCYKHFPGIGSADNDMHTGYSEIDKAAPDLKDDLYPFSTAAINEVDFCMAGHVGLPQILGEGVLCSCSDKYIVGVLRKQFGYEGVIITDAMNMGVITEKYQPGEASVLMLQAGCDMLLMPEDLDQAVTGVTEALEKGVLTEERIDESLRRIFRLKFK